MERELALFRPEALAEQRTQWLGPVLLAPRFSHRLLVFAAALAAAAVLGPLFFASYTRTARVSGWLVPKSGLARVLAPQPGVVAKIHVAEGAAVREGDPLVTLSGELQSAAFGATQGEIVRRLAERRASLTGQRDYERRYLPIRQQDLARKAASLDAQAGQVAAEIELQKSRVAIAERNEALHRRLGRSGYVSELRLQQVQAETLEQRARLHALERELDGVRQQYRDAEQQLRDLPSDAAKEIARLEREIAALEQERAQAEALREFVVTAPYDGVVSAVIAVPGMRATPGVALLSLVPADAELEAQLFSPSRTIGFVHPGQAVHLRYQAYPYQKFGHYAGTVARVSRSPVSAGELPPQLTSAPSAASSGAGLTAGAGEPLYRIEVALAQQTVTAYGRQAALQPGMMLDADVALDRRRLYEWVLEPLYTLSGRWQ